MVAGLIVILGAPNGDDGQLSRMAQGRVVLGYQLYRERQAVGWRLLLTGGFGEHFIEAVASLQDMLRGNINIRRLAVGTT